jgi:hypothetical protein
MSDFEHKKFNKLYRYSDQRVVVTEKIDGTNGLVFIDLETDTVLAGSRNRWVVVGEDNYGFAQFVEDNREDLKSLGDGYHYGEWWGLCIQRNYGMDRKVFSLFNPYRYLDTLPHCCDVVPVVFDGAVTEYEKEFTDRLSSLSSTAAAKYDVSFDNIEGYVVYFAGSKVSMKHIINKEK